MKSIFTSLAGLLLLCSCTTTPTAPPTRPHQTKYAIEVLEVRNTSQVKLDPNRNKAEQLIMHPDSEIFTHPLLFVSAGESVINDRTKTVPLTESYDVVEGKVVPRLKDVRLGRALKIAIAEADPEKIRYTINLYFKQLIGHDTYPAGNSQIQIPIFKSWTIDTEVTQALGKWHILGGIFGADNNRFVCVRITPPKDRTSSNPKTDTP